MNNIDITTTSTIKYRGDVTIEFVKNGKIVRTIKKHNSATKYLFEFIYHCLAGNFYQDELPSFVIPLTEVGGQYYLYNTNFTPITKVIVEDNNTVVTYKCLIGYNTLEIGKDVAGLGFYALKNKNSDEMGIPIQNQSMAVIFENPYTPQADDRSDLLITWQVQVTNAGTIEPSDDSD